MKNITNFGKEWERYKHENNFRSAQDAIDNTNSISTFAPETISRYCTGKRKIPAENLELFSELFGVRTEYLSGSDPYRTIEDKKLGEKKDDTIYSAFHTIISLLGYADFDMDDADYNETFPINTQLFMDNIKKDFQTNNISLIFDVNTNSFIALKNDEYDELIAEFVDFINFKIQRYFAEPHRTFTIPNCEIEDMENGVHHIWNGQEELDKMPYVPTLLDARLRRKNS